MKCLLDTGSQINLICRSAALGKPLYKDQSTNINGIGGKKKTYGAVKVDYLIGGFRLRDIFHIVDDECITDFDMFLGSNFFTSNKLCFDFCNMQLIHENFRVPVLIEEIRSKTGTPCANEVEYAIGVVHPVDCKKEDPKESYKEKENGEGKEGEEEEEGNKKGLSNVVADELSRNLSNGLEQEQVEKIGPSVNRTVHSGDEDEEDEKDEETLEENLNKLPTGESRKVGQTIDLKMPCKYVEELHRDLKEVWGQAKENIIAKKEKVAEREKERVKRRKVEEFSVGDNVLVMTQTLKGRTNRTVPVWTGPFLITTVNERTLDIKKRNRVVTVNKANCKLYEKE